MGMTAGAWGAIGTGAGALMSAGSAMAQREEMKDAAKQAEAEAAANAQMVDIQKEKNERLLENKFEREQAARNTYFGKYGGGASALEVLSGAADSYEQDKGALETTAELNKAGIYYSADAKRKQALSRANQATGTAYDSLLSGGARAYRAYRGL